MGHDHCWPSRNHITTLNLNVSWRHYLAEPSNLHHTIYIKLNYMGWAHTQTVLPYVMEAGGYRACASHVGWPTIMQRPHVTYQQPSPRRNQCANLLMPRLIRVCGGYGACRPMRTRPQTKNILWFFQNKGIINMEESMFDHLTSSTQFRNFNHNAKWHFWKICP